jgi:hypothetical protein
MQMLKIMILEIADGILFWGGDWRRGACQMIQTIITCAMLLNLSLPTKLEMRPVFPFVASHCMAHPRGALKVTFTPIKGTERK